MKRVGLALLLGLVLGGVYLLANTGKLSLDRGSVLRQKSFALYYTAFYTGCQHEESREEHHSPRTRDEMLAGLTKDGWAITGFTMERVELKKEVPTLCPGCQEHEFVGLYGNEIAVYAGSPEKPG
ncbi:MAG: hypothetical protein GX202_03475, partial [Firmicutes bacterium]|nr:hypothetical protein [Bacillota bacterium]